MNANRTISIVSRLRIRKTFLLSLLFIGILLLGASGAFAQSGEAIPSTPAWQPPTIDAVKSQIESWLDDVRTDAATKAKVQELWADVPSGSGEEEILERLAATFSLADENAKKLTALCAAPRSQLILSKQTWLADSQLSAFMTCNMRLYYACWLVQQSLLDEARDQLVGLQAVDVAAPSVLLFYQSVVYHKLLERDSGLKTIDELLQGPESSPRRYRNVAKMMKEDLKDLEEDSLDHIARRMDDIRRRLDLGRAGPKVRSEEDGVIESLDKLIKQIEDQQQQQDQQSANQLRSSKPAEDSKIAGGRGPGDVDRKNIGARSGWGDLPPKEREEALQQIGRDLPANYADVIDQYFKRLASENSDNK